MKRSLIPAVIAVLLFAGCGDNVEVTSTVLNKVTLDLNYVVGNETLQMDQMIYTNEAGNVYSVTDMRYILSDFIFRAEDGSDHRSDAVFYASSDREDLSTLTFLDIPYGSYTGISFVIGLQPELNVLDGLANTQDFNEMIWPTGMGGGYHFMKFEGHFIDSVGQQKGFAWHLGRNSSIMPFDLDHEFNLSSGSNGVGTLTMDIEKYFVDPITIDLDSTVFSMMNVPHMEKLAANGLDVFSIE